MPNQLRSQKRILCFGDSNTFGYDSVSIWGDCYEKPWPAILEKLTGFRCINMGQNGRELPHYQSSVAFTFRQIERKLPADLVIILLGTNDILNVWKDEEAVLEEHLNIFLSEYQKAFPGLRTLYLIPMEVDRLGSKISSVSHAFREIAAKTCCQFNVPYYDTNDWNLPLGPDGVHLTEEGHRLLAVKVSEIINKI